MKILKNKWIIFLVAITLFVIMDIEVKNVTLSERAIVLGVGIDKESDEYIVTTEIIAPSNMGAENYQKNRLLSLERGKTIEEAFERMDKALGVRVSLKHTILLVLGESMLEAGEYAPIMDLFVGNDVSDDVYIVGVESKASELFSAKPPLYSTISYKVSETFRSPDIASGIVRTNIKDFLKMYLSESRAICIPIVDVSHGNISESNGSGKDEETDSINFGKIAVLDSRGQRVILSREESEGLSYIYSNVNEANLYVEDENGGGGFDVDILDTLTTKKCDVGANTLTIDIKMWVKIGHRKSNYMGDYISPLNDAERTLAGGIIAREVKNSYLTCHKEGVDILGIKNEYFKKFGSRYKDILGVNYLDDTKINIDVTLIDK